MEFGEILKNHLKKEHISMSEFARRSHVSKAYISLLINGVNTSTGKEYIPSMKILSKIANGMGTNLEELEGQVLLDSLKKPFGVEFVNKRTLLYAVAKMSEKQAEATLKMIQAAKAYQES